MKRISYLIAGLTAAFLLALQPALAVEPVGSVERVNVYAYGTIKEKSRAPLYKLDRVYFGERLETVVKGGLKIVFIDDTNLYLGSESDLVIDAFVFDPKGGLETAILKMNIGIFRFVSGKMTKMAVKIDTPAAYIGIRGTDFTVSVLENGKTTISIESGEIEVSPKDGSPSSVVAAGTVGSVSPGGGGFTVGSPADAPSDPGVSDGAGGDSSGVGGGGDSGSGSGGSGD